MQTPMPPVKRNTPTRAGRAQVLALATACGLAAALLSYFGLARRTQGAGATGARAALVVVARDLPARVPLTPGVLAVRRVPLAAFPAGAFTDPAQAVGQVTVAPLAVGQVVTRAEVTDRTHLAGTATAVAPSHRAVAVPLDPVSGMAGFLEPGDHVDVLATFDIGAGPGVTRTVLQDVPLLALGGRTEAASGDSGDDAKPATSATLEVTPRGAQALAQAAARGKIQIALRGLADPSQPSLPDLSARSNTGPGTVAPRTMNKARRREAPKPSPTPAVRPPVPEPTVAPAPALPRINVIRGTETTTVTVGE